MPLETLTFSAPEDDDAGFGAYHDLYASGSDVARGEGRFHARVVAHRFQRMLVFERHLAGLVHGRGPARIRRDGFDHLSLQLLLAGRFAGGPPGDERALAPGEILVFDTARPQRTLARDAHVITLSLAREVVEAAAPRARRVHGAVLPQTASGLLGDLMVSLVRRAGSLSPESAAGAGRAVAELFGAALADGLGDGSGEGAAEPGGEPLAELRRGRAEAYIDAHLHDPHLDADRIAGGIGLSRSALYRVFAPEGVAEAIRGRRLARLRHALRRPNETRSVASLAYAHGFVSESHCSRAFRAAYGMPPGQYRAEARAARLALAAGEGEGRAEAALAAWHCELY